MRCWASSEGPREEREVGQEGRKGEREEERRVGGGAVGMHIHRGSVMVQRCESINELTPSFLRLGGMCARDAGDGDSCVPCPPSRHPFRCHCDKGDFVFQPVTEPTKV